jgi:hypothetical protein
MFNPTIKEIEAHVDYASTTATEWVRDILVGQNDNITTTAAIVGISTFKCADIKKNCGIIDRSDIAIRVLKMKEIYDKAHKVEKDNFKPAEIPVVIGVEPGRGLPPPKVDVHL